jgi:hypothetical protein
MRGKNEELAKVWETEVKATTNRLFPERADPMFDTDLDLLPTTTYTI